MPKGPTKRRPETRAKLLEAAASLFASGGYGATSIGEICRKAGYTSGAFYSNFESKEELFFALFEAHAERAIESIKQRLDALSGDDLTISDLIEPFAELGPEERDWFLISAEFTLHALRNPDAAAVLAAHDERVWQLAAPVIQRVLDHAGVEAPRGAEHLVRLLVALREGGLTQSLVEPEDLGHGELERTYLPLLFNGFKPSAK